MMEEEDSRNSYLRKLKYFIPYRCHQNSKKKYHFEYQGWIQLCFYTWLNSLIWKGLHKTLDLEDLGEPSEEFEPKNTLKKLKECLSEEEKRAGGLKYISLPRVCWRMCQSKIISDLCLSIVWIGSEFVVTAIIIRKFFEFLEEGESRPSTEGFILIAIIFPLYFLRQSALNMSFFLGSRTGCYLKSAFLALLYDKALKLKKLSKSTGEIINLFSNDVSRLFEACLFFRQIIVFPLLIIVHGSYMAYYFGNTALIGYGLLALNIPLQMVLSRAFSSLRAKAVAVTDKRVKMITEALSSIKLIKMYAWEKSFSGVINDLREKEKRQIMKMALSQGFTLSIAIMISLLSPPIIVICAVYLGDDISISKVFTLINMFNLTIMYSNLAPTALRGLMESYVSCKRIKEFLLMEEYKKLDTVCSDERHVLELSGCNFSWKTTLDQLDGDNEEVTQLNHEKTVNDEAPMRVDGQKKASGTNNMNAPSTMVSSFDDEVGVMQDSEDSEITNGEFKGVKEDKYEVSFKPQEKKFQEKDIFESEPGENECLLQPESEPNSVLLPTLHNISLVAEKGSLIGICGSVGSGKSSLLQAVLNEMEMTSGTLAITNSVAYVPQQAWVLNTTFRENILFGKEYEEPFFKEVCTICGLDDDLKQMQSGDLTEIGEQGVNLSGGQKQRLSLARAVYAEKDLYLLDDPLSAVDPHIGAHIFKFCIKAALRKHAVVFVTHQLQYLKDCDYVIYMNNGMFHEQGTYEELMAKNGAFAADIKKFHSEHQKQHKKKTYGEELYHLATHNLKSNLSVSNFALSEMSVEELAYLDCDDAEEIQKLEAEKELIEKGKITQEEERKKGAVTWQTYISFIRFSGGFIVFFFILLTFMTKTCLLFLSSYWISEWLSVMGRIVRENEGMANSTSEAQLTEKTQYYIHGLSILTGVLLLNIILGMVVVVLFVLKGSSRMHNAVFEIVFKSPMSFFDSTPIGRIVNRLAKDVDEIDSFLPLLFETFLNTILRTSGNFILVVVILPWMAIAVVLIIIPFYFINIVFRRVVRETKRIENVTRSPLFSLVNTSTQGLLSVQSYGKELYFTERFHKILNGNMTALYLFYGTSRWFSQYMDLLCLTFYVVSAVVAVFLRHSIQPSLIVFALAQATKIVGLTQFTIRIIAEVESRFTSVERLNHYVKTLKSEGEFETKDKSSIQDWPKDGSIVFDNVSLRYRDNLPLVLKDISLSIGHKEKVGIVGRTGAGKSSIGVVLFRLVNPEQGSIIISGVDAAKIGLTDLRSALTIIPQDPILFIGTLRYNLDPFNDYDDEELWNVLERAHIKDLVSELPNKLESIVLENGSNFSVGERQLICLARALLRKCKILLLDEATAAIDSRTDSEIQNTIKESFVDCTVLTIAHRLNTIMHCDKIIVMEEGKIAEFDTPTNLLQRTSKFKNMVDTAKIASTTKVVSSCKFAN